MELQKHLAYNQTNEYFLGLDVVAADFSSASLMEWIPALRLNSDAGLWLLPFRGIPATNGQIPIDLIYLDDKYRVIEVVEDFPRFRVSESSPQATSVLALPARSISSSQTRKGDQLVLWVAKEMASRLEQSSRSRDPAHHMDSANLPPIKTVRSSVEEVPQSVKRAEGDVFKSELTPLPAKAQSFAKTEFGRFFSTKNRLKRWWSPDPRKAFRHSSPDLSASFWTGATPEESHAIRDISATGIFLVTGERWCPGTVIRMLLTDMGNGRQNPRQSISVLSRAVRWGNEGVGLQFVVQESQKLRIGQNSVTEGANRKELDEFLVRIGMGGSNAPGANLA